MMETSADAFANLALTLAMQRPGAVVRTVRGRKSRTVASFYDEVAAALQLPYYFGENWNALGDLLNDLEWLPGDAYLVMISDADQLLAEAEDESFRILMDSFSQARVGWLTPNLHFPRNRPPTPFHVVLHAPEEEGARRLSERLLGVGAAFDLIVNPPPTS
jgi:RNAse (barnase) inhibitor barstar